MLVIMGATALAAAAVLLLALGSWWVLVPVLLVHALGTLLVLGYTLRRASQAGEKPDPVTEARVEEERVAERRRARRQRPRDREVFN